MWEGQWQNMRHRPPDDEYSYSDSTGGKHDEAHERLCSYNGLSSNQQIETML